MAPEIEIDKRAHMFVQKHLSTIFDSIADKKLRNSTFVDSKNRMLSVLKKNFKEQNRNKMNAIHIIPVLHHSDSPTLLIIAIESSQAIDIALKRTLLLKLNYTF